MADKYEKLDLIGSGTFGKAWLVAKRDSGRRYVVKEIQVVGMSERAKKQALTEVTALSRCKHINVIRYKEAFVHQTALWIAMEYADGGDLYKKIKEQQKIGPFLHETVLDLFIQLCFGLQYIHSCNIIHRDLKTQNLFLTVSGLLKVGDLGIARILKQSEDYANTAVGTPYYLSPEICKRKPYDYKTDMWSAGCVLYELCTTGKRPFENPNSFSALVLTIVQGKYKPIPKECGSILEDLVSILLKVNPDSRPTAEQILCIPALQPAVMTYIQKSKQHKEQHAAPSPGVIDSANRVSARKHSEGKGDGTVLSQRRKRSLSTPRNPAVLSSKRKVNSEECQKKPQGLQIKATISPKVSLYKEVLRKRQPLGTLATKNTPGHAFTIRADSPIANRLRKTAVITSPIANRLRKTAVLTSPKVLHILDENSGSPCVQSEPQLRTCHEVNQCLVDTLTRGADELYGNIETARVFLERRLGEERFSAAYSKLQALGSSRVRDEEVFSEPDVMVCFPLLVHLLQLEHFSKF